MSSVGQAVPAWRALLEGSGRGVWPSWAREQPFPGGEGAADTVTVASRVDWIALLS